MTLQSRLAGRTPAADERMLCTLLCAQPEGEDELPGAKDQVAALPGLQQTGGAPQKTASGQRGRLGG